MGKMLLAKHLFDYLQSGKYSGSVIFYVFKLFEIVKCLKHLMPDVS